MLKQKGFTLIEMMIVVVFILSLGLVVMGAVSGSTQGNTISWGVNGMTEMRCIDGYKFTVSDRGSVRQVMDEFGKGVKCN
jgi:prepilin-type N-terminal cleavage/methylation domain-containing protein